MDGEMNNAPGEGTTPQNLLSGSIVPAPRPQSPKWRNPITVIVIIVILALIGGGYYYFFFKDGSRVTREGGEEKASNMQAAPPPPPPAPKASEGTAPPPKPVISTENWLRYQNSQYGFEIKYPPEWAAEASFGKENEFVYLGPTVAGAGSINPAVAVDLYPGEGTLQGILKKFDYLKGEYRDITVDSVPAKEITVIDQNAREVIVVVFARGGIGYSLTAGGFGGTYAAFETSKKILSTFAFLE